MTDKITLEVCKDGLTGKPQLSINKVDENGVGGGYRLAGPKFNGSSKLLLQTELDQRDADEIRAYLDAVFPVKPASDATPESAPLVCGFELDDGSVAYYGVDGAQ
jgi:hypothetical protein